MSTWGMKAEANSSNLTINGMLSKDYFLARPAIVIPLAQSSKQILNLHAIGMFDKQKNLEGNFGLGYRSMSNTMIIGAYGFFDIRRSNTSNVFHQITLGTELLFQKSEFRLNIYSPIGKEKQASNQMSISTVKQSNRKYIYQRNVDAYNEQALGGADIEFGSQIMSLPVEVFCTLYTFGKWQSKVASFTGMRVRGNVSVNRYISLHANVQYDQQRKLQYHAGITLQVSLEQQKAKVFKHKMTSNIQRDVDIVTQKKLVSSVKDDSFIAVELSGTDNVIFPANISETGGDIIKNTGTNKAVSSIVSTDNVYIITDNTIEKLAFAKHAKLMSPLLMETVFKNSKWHDAWLYYIGESSVNSQLYSDDIDKALKQLGESADTYVMSAFANIGHIHNPGLSNLSKHSKSVEELKTYVKANTNSQKHSDLHANVTHAKEHVFINNRRFVVVPIHVGSAQHGHWMSLVLDSKNNWENGYLFNSIGPSQHTYAHIYSAALAANTNINLHDLSKNVQRDGVSCGTWAVESSKAIVQSIRDDQDPSAALAVLTHQHVRTMHRNNLANR